MKKSSLAFTLFSSLALTAASAPAAECDSPRVDVNTVAICGPFGPSTVPFSQGFSLFDGEGASFITGLGGDPIFLRVGVEAPATTALALAYDENGDSSCFAQDFPGGQFSLAICLPEEVVTHDVVVLYPD